MAILFPIFALYGLTLFVQLRLAYLGFQAARSGEISPGYFRLFRGDTEPDELAAYSRHYVNLHEAPLQFYIVCLIIYVTQTSSTLLVGLAWLYVALRLWHSWIHLGSNHVLHRFRAFALSGVVLGSI